MSHCVANYIICLTNCLRVVMLYMNFIAIQNRFNLRDNIHFSCVKKYPGIVRAHSLVAK